MKLLFVLVAPVLVLATVHGAAAADVSGTWKIDGSVFFHDVDPTCTLKQEGSKLTGTCSSQADGTQLTGEAPDGKTVNWQYTVDDKGDKHELKFMGVLDSDKTMKGKLSADGHGGSFTAQKQ